jgi:methyl-accepting chemotaxis protein
VFGRQALDHTLELGQRCRGRFADEICAALAIAILLIFILAVVASVSVTRRTVGRVESINGTSRAIMKSGLGRGIPLRGTEDEWDHLAQNLNSMLERIEVLMAEVKQVGDNVAHDLRTPLPAPEPIKGRIPLPRHRPSVRAPAATANMATTGSIAPTGPLPLPRVRPTDTPVDTSPATNAPHEYEPRSSRH